MEGNYEPNKGREENVGRVFPVINWIITCKGPWLKGVLCPLRNERKASVEVITRDGAESRGRSIEDHVKDDGTYPMHMPFPHKETFSKQRENIRAAPGLIITDFEFA